MTGKVNSWSYDERTKSGKGTVCTKEEGRTRQEDTARSDINEIVPGVARGLFPPVRQGGVYADVSDLPVGLHARLNEVKRAEAEFAKQPPEVRAAFDNELGLFLQAFESEEGVKKLKGLKVIPLSEEELADRREAAKEARAEARRIAREQLARIEAAKNPPRERPS